GDLITRLTIVGQDRQPTMCADCDEVRTVARIIETPQAMRDGHLDDRRRPAVQITPPHNRLHATPVGAELARPAMVAVRRAMPRFGPAMPRFGPPCRGSARHAAVRPQQVCYRPLDR